MFLKKWLGQFFQICINIASFAGFCILVAEMQLFVQLQRQNLASRLYGTPCPISTSYF